MAYGTGRRPRRSVGGAGSPGRRGTSVGAGVRRTDASDKEKRFSSSRLSPSRPRQARGCFFFPHRLRLARLLSGDAWPAVLASDGLMGLGNARRLALHASCTFSVFLERCGLGRKTRCHENEVSPHVACGLTTVYDGRTTTTAEESRRSPAATCSAILVVARRRWRYFFKALSLLSSHIALIVFR
jgi:hypothetical protein